MTDVLVSIFGAGIIWALGFMCGKLTGPRPKIIKDKNFRWFKISEHPLPKGNSNILVYAPCWWSEYSYSVENLAKMKYNDKGEPMYITHVITHWAYLPAPFKGNFYPTKKLEEVKCD